VERIPTYFRALDGHRVIAAPDARNDPRIGELNGVYLAPLSITSLLAASADLTGNTFQNLFSADTLTFPGVTLSSLNFGFPFQGFGTAAKTTVSNFSLVRDGGHFFGAQDFPALWVFAATNVFTGIRVTDGTITDPTYAGIMFQTDYVGGTPQSSVQDTIFTNTTITGAQPSTDQFSTKSGFGIWANPLPEAGQGPATGSATFNGLTESNNSVNIQNATSTFTITVN